MKRTVRLISQRQRDYAKRLIDAAEDGDFVSISAPTRTLEQNALLWPLIEQLRDEVPGMSAFTKEDIKLRFMDLLGAELRFLPKLDDEGFFPVGHRSSTLTKEQFSALLELIYEWGARHGVKWVDRRAA